jgi:type IV secretory pathway TrbD component
MYLRYMAIENGTVSLACQAGLQTWLCGTFRLTIILFNHEVFGGVALTAALLNLIRPSLVLLVIALSAAAFGVVLHNADLSALAAGVLILSLARPVPVPE